MRFTSDAQRRAAFANMRMVPGVTVRNMFSAKVRDGLNGVVCEKCGDVMDEDSAGSHVCSDISLDRRSEFSENPSVIEEITVDEDEFYEDEDEYEDGGLFD